MNFVFQDKNNLISQCRKKLKLMAKIDEKNYRKSIE